MGRTDAQRIAELDGLRGIAIIAVIIFHYTRPYLEHSGSPCPRVVWPLLSIGWSGVDLFFVLSGFLIGSILLRNADSASYYKASYMRRAFRILPIYAVSMLAFVPLFKWLGAPGMPWWVYVTFTQSAYVALAASTPLLAFTWSLSVEEWFYATSPFIIRKFRRALPCLCGAAIVICPAARLFMFNSLGASAAYYMPFSRIDGLATGVLIASANLDGWIGKLVRPARITFFLILLVGIYSIYPRGWVNSLIQLTLGLSAFPLLFGSVLTLVATNRVPWFVMRALRNPHLTLIGKVSYSIYLLHVPAEYLALMLPFGGWARLLIAIATTLVLADLSWRFLESPMIDRGRRFNYARALLAGIDEPVLAMADCAKSSARD